MRKNPFKGAKRAKPLFGALMADNYRVPPASVDS